MEDSFAFIGLGAMGFGMAGNIRQKMQASATLYVFDINLEACEGFTAKFDQFGPIEIAKSVKEAARNAKVLISSLPSADAVREAYLGDTDCCIRTTRNLERLILDTSTIEPSTARELAKNVSETGVGYYVDTPLSGGPQAAASGKLSFMIGHTKPEESDPMGGRIQHILEMLGDPQKLFWCGRIGAGLTAKISNNYIACSVLLLVAEAMAIGVRGGLDPELLYEVIHNSSGQTFMGDILHTVQKAYPNSNVFPIDLMIKDLALGMMAGKAAEVSPRMAQMAWRIWHEAAENPDVLYLDALKDFKPE
ncbi:uncharacterized protein N7496_009318 [Penicillium cataractarum]|uniref:6-phosphogluconate dehydrogenase NADP-binding domain-containing protein n=1 Tax=Penicillium cataractarum TaxID=2100454 RepID=A0A9W9RNR2_9EURO|nr:uncharacterized protein N7496_009318 [Penicillium cataractarum]KAJ5363605.1 hypothetical protein N7496_009318 [Penicillium cataractarum]